MADEIKTNGEKVSRDAIEHTARDWRDQVKRDTGKDIGNEAALRKVRERLGGSVEVAGEPPEFTAAVQEAARRGEALDITYWTTGKAWMPPIDYVSFWKDPIRNLSMVALPAITVPVLTPITSAPANGRSSKGARSGLRSVQVAHRLST